MKRRGFVLFSLTSSVSLLAACGGGGDSGPDRAFPAWNKGGSIQFGQDSITVTFDLSQGHLLGLATRDANDHNPDERQRRDDPTRIIKPEEVKEIWFSSQLMGWDEHTVARAPFDPKTGVVVIPNTASADAGYFRAVLHMGESIPFAVSRKDSRWDVSGESVSVTADNAIQYGDYRLGKITFFSDRAVLRIDFGANVLGGLSEFVKPADVVKLQWASELMHWFDSPATGTLQVTGRGDYFVEIGQMPNNDQGYVFVWLRGDTKPHIVLNAKSPRWGLKDTVGITLL